MINSNLVYKKDIEPLQFSRWVLFMINAAAASGLENINRQRLHALLFLSFASAPYYGIRPLRKRAQRTNVGPYYRAAHISLGSLVMSGLVRVEDYRGYYFKNNFQFDAIFHPTLNGLEVCENLKKTRVGGRLYRYLLDLCLGAVSVIESSKIEARHTDSDVDIELLLKSDFTYQQAIERSGLSLIVEEYPEEINPTVAGLLNIDKYMSSKAYFNQKDILQAYQSLLVKRIA